MNIYKISHNIIGSYYHNHNHTKLVIRATGFPTTPKDYLEFKSILESNKYDFFAPDYIGSGRSEGVFTPQSCIDTLEYSYQHFIHQNPGKNIFTGLFLQKTYNQIIVIGKSFGGGIVVSWLGQGGEAKDIGLIAPALFLHEKPQDGVIQETFNQIGEWIMDGYHCLYKGLIHNYNTLRKSFFLGLNTDILSPLYNLPYIYKKNIYLCHGDSDTSIPYQRSINAYEILNQSNSIKRDLMQGYGHSNQINTDGLKKCLSHFNLRHPHA